MLEQRRESPESRAAHALAVLRQAELRTGARRAVLAPVANDAPTGGARGAQRGPRAVEQPAGAGAPGADPRAPRADRGTVAPSRLGVQVQERPPLPVPPQLDAVLPHGLQRGAVTQVTGSTALVLALLAEACGRQADLGDEPWAAVVGNPTIGLVAAAQMGVPLERLVLVPDAGREPATVVAALVDGMDVVVLGDLDLTDAERRRLSARVREQGTVLLATAPWRGARTTLRVTGVRWRGLGHGTGRLVDRELTVVREDSTRASIDIALPFDAAPPVEVPASLTGGQPGAAAPDLPDLTDRSDRSDWSDLPGAAAARLRPAASPSGASQGASTRQEPVPPAAAERLRLVG